MTTNDNKPDSNAGQQQSGTTPTTIQGTNGGQNPPTGGPADSAIDGAANWGELNGPLLWALIGGGVGAGAGALFTNSSPDESSAERTKRRLMNALLLGGMGAGAGYLIHDGSNLFATDPEKKDNTPETTLAEDTRNVLNAGAGVAKNIGQGFKDFYNENKETVDELTQQGKDLAVGAYNNYAHPFWFTAAGALGSYGVHKGQQAAMNARLGEAQQAIVDNLKQMRINYEAQYAKDLAENKATLDRRCAEIDKKYPHSPSIRNAQKTKIIEEHRKMRDAINNRYGSGIRSLNAAHIPAPENANGFTLREYANTPGVRDMTRIPANRELVNTVNRQIYKGGAGSVYFSPYTNPVTHFWNGKGRRIGKKAIPLLLGAGIDGVRTIWRDMDRARQQQQN